MFDFDPDDLVDEIEKLENYDPDDLVEDDLDYDPTDLANETEYIDDDNIEKAIIAGTIFGMGVEEGQNETTAKKSSKKERSVGAIPLKERKGKTNLRPFEQHVLDMAKGKIK